MKRLRTFPSFRYVRNFVNLISIQLKAFFIDLEIDVLVPTCQPGLTLTGKGPDRLCRIRVRLENKVTLMLL